MLRDFCSTSAFELLIVHSPVSLSVGLSLCSIAIAVPLFGANSRQHFDKYDQSYELNKTSPLVISPQLFHSKLKTLLFNKSHPDSSSSPYLPPRLNSKHHPPYP